MSSGPVTTDGRPGDDDPSGGSDVRSGGGSHDRGEGAGGTCCGGGGDECCGGSGSGSCTLGGSCSCSTDETAASIATMPDLGQDWVIADLDDEWEERAREQLDTVEFDTDLGVELSKDALRVAQGELTQPEFHEKYHEAVEAEFGIDERPTRPPEPQPGTDADGNPLPGVPTAGRDGRPSRRQLITAMGAMAAGGAAAGLAGCTDAGATEMAPSAAAPDESDGDVQMGMAIDMERCIACLLCVEGCKEENDTDRGTHWMHVFRYEEDEYGETREGYMPRPCQHCTEPSCTYVCPTQARYKRDADGIVLTNYDTCIGCKYCEVACPYGVNFLGKGDPVSDHEDRQVRQLSPGFHGSETDHEDVTVGGPPPEGIMGKCTFCVHRQDDAAQRGTTACEDACPVDAIHFGDMNDPDSAPREHLRERRGAPRFNLLEQTGNEPNVVYLGDEPSKDARPIDGPYTYGDLGMTTLADGHEEPTGRTRPDPAELSGDDGDEGGTDS